MNNMLYDEKSTEEGNISEKCPSCYTSFSIHSTSDLYNCAMMQIHPKKLEGTSQ